MWIAENTQKYFYPLTLAINNNFFKKIYLSGPVWTHVSIFDFWLISFIAVKTVKISLRKIKCILNEINTVWYNRLFSIGGNLISKYAVININFTRFSSNIVCVALCDMLDIISIFNNGFEHLTIRYQFIILNVNIDMSLCWINLDIHKFYGDSNALLFVEHNFLISSLFILSYQALMLVPPI